MSVRDKELTNYAGNLVTNDFFAVDQESSNETKRADINSILSGLPLASSISGAGLMSGTDKTQLASVVAAMHTHSHLTAIEAFSAKLNTLGQVATADLEVVSDHAVKTDNIASVTGTVNHSDAEVFSESVTFNNGIYTPGNVYVDDTGVVTTEAIRTVHGTLTVHDSILKTNTGNIESGDMVKAANNIQIKDIGGCYYFGDMDTDGSWRMGVHDGNMLIQERVTGSWVTKQTITG